MQRFDLTVFKSFGCDLNLMLVLHRMCNSPVNRAKRNLTLTVARVKAFTYEELTHATDNFSDEKQVGQGGNGKVYLGILNEGKK